MAGTIQEYVDERGIKFLMHFTKASNLQSILQRGLLVRDTLAKEGNTEFNDQHRLDGTDAVCLTIGFPNYKMFWGLRQDEKDVEWVVLVIHPNAMWELPCAFCVTNAASASVTAVPLGQRRNLAALKAMYADWGEKARSTLAIPDHFPTNPQAEVLMLTGVPRKYIFGVVVLNVAMQVKVKTQFPEIGVSTNVNYFRYRKDYSHWKQGN